MLLAPDGTLLASSDPAIPPPDVSQLAGAWTAAVTGTAAWSPSFPFQGQAAWATVTPVGGAQHWANLVLVQESVDTVGQAFVSRLGTLGTGRRGGFTLTGSGGSVIYSWDLAKLGTRAPDIARFAPQARTQNLVQVTGHGAQEVTSIYRSDASGFVGAFQQPSAELFSDLRAQQLQRDLTLVAVLVAAIALLVIGSLIRVRAVRRTQARLHALLSNSQDLIMVFDVVGQSGDRRADQAMYQAKQAGRGRYAMHSG